MLPRNRSRSPALGPCVGGVGRQSASRGSLLEPSDDLGVHVIRIAELQVMHPTAGRGLHHLFETRRCIMPVERDGQHDVSVRPAEVLAGQPEVREPPPSPECDLTLRRSSLERPELAQALTHRLVDRTRGRVPIEEVLRRHDPDVRAVLSVPGSGAGWLGVRWNSTAKVAGSSSSTWCWRAGGMATLSPARAVIGWSGSSSKMKVTVPVWTTRFPHTPSATRCAAQETGGHAGVVDDVGGADVFESVRQLRSVHGLTPGLQDSVEPARQ